MAVQDDHHGTFHLDHCGALMDVEPLGDEFVVAMCHHIEDPTFDATGWATNPKLRMRPVHRPPRNPSDRTPHCAWTVTIDPEEPDTPTPLRSLEIGRTNAAELPVAAIEGPSMDGYADYARPLDPDLRLSEFSTPVLRALIDEVTLQGHLLVLSFASAVAERCDEDTTRKTVAQQFTGVAGVAAERLARAFDLGDSAADVATVFALHPAFHPRTYVDWSVELHDDVVHLALGDGPARTERFESWIGVLAAGHDRALRAIAMGVDPHWTVEPDGEHEWVAHRSDAPGTEFDEVTLTEILDRCRVRVQAIRPVARMTTERQECARWSEPNEALGEGSTRGRTMTARTEVGLIGRPRVESMLRAGLDHSASQVLPATHPHEGEPAQDGREVGRERPLDEDGGRRLVLRDPRCRQGQDEARLCDPHAASGR